MCTVNTNELVVVVTSNDDALQDLRHCTQTVCGDVKAKRIIPKDIDVKTFDTCLLEKSPCETIKQLIRAFCASHTDNRSLGFVLCVWMCCSVLGIARSGNGSAISSPAPSCRLCSLALSPHRVYVRCSPNMHCTRRITNQLFVET